MLASGFREEHYEERYQPLEALRSLIEFDLYTQFIFHDDLEVLPVSRHQQPVSLAVCWRDSRPA